MKYEQFYKTLLKEDEIKAVIKELRDSEISFKWYNRENTFILRRKSLKNAILRLPINVKVKGKVDSLNNFTQIKISLMSAMSVIDVIIFIILTFVIFAIVGITKSMEMSGISCFVFGATIFSFLLSNLLPKFTSISLDLYTDTINILIRALQLEEI